MASQVSQGRGRTSHHPQTAQIQDHEDVAAHNSLYLFLRVALQRLQEAEGGGMRVPCLSHISEGCDAQAAAWQRSTWLPEDARGSNRLDVDNRKQRVMKKL